MKVITRETMLEERRGQSAEVHIPFNFGKASKEVITHLVNGEMETLELDKPVGEMLTTPAGLYTVIQKSLIDLQLGRETVPLLYGPVYRKVEDRNFSQYVDVAPFINAQVIFLEKMEMEGVKMGHRKIGAKDTVPIITFASGFEWTEDMVEYDKTWEITQLNRAMGEAYNALLNHMHFNPILAYTYAAKNKTAANATETTYREKLRATLKAALIHAAADKNTDTAAPRRPNILLAHSSKRWDLEECVQRMVIGGTEYPAVSGIDTMIFYDGWSTMVGDKAYSYSGVDPTKAYLIEGQKYFRELVKHDLIVDAQDGDLTHLVEKVMVGRCRRGLIASPANAVEEITLP